MGGAPVLLVTTEGDEDAAKYADEVITVLASDPLFAPFPHTAALHVLAYEVAAMRGCSIDKPRNLAKSVTVE